MKDRIKSILLLFVLIAPAVTTYWWLQLQKSIVRHSIKKKRIEGMDEHALVLLKFTKKESEINLKWEHSKEFEYNEQMYDIVKTKIFGDTIYYWCWWDHEETKLNLQLAQRIENAVSPDPQNREKQHQLLSYYNSLYFLENGNLRLVPPGTAHKQILIYLISFSPVSFQPPTPPPRLS